MLRNVLLVAAGGMVGSVARYLVAVYFTHRYGPGFPLGTLVVNIVGCFVIGVVLGLVGRIPVMSSEVRLLLATGFCGGFTTFSSFMYEVVELVEAQHAAVAILYVVGSVLLGLVATLSGLLVTR